MSTREAFHNWNDQQPESFYEGKNKYDLMLEAWQACQAHNDTVIAELKENLRIAKSAADAEALEVDSRGKLIAELVEALHWSVYRLDSYYDEHQEDKVAELQALIAKHKGQS